jgi:hypothetical protein
LSIPWESLRTAACCGRPGDPEGGPEVVTSESADNGLSSIGEATPPWLDTLERDVVFVMAGRQYAWKHYHDISCKTMANIIVTLFLGKSLLNLLLLGERNVLME